MKKYYNFVIFFLLSLFLILDINFEAEASIYRIISPEGITLRVTTEPILTEQEARDDCKLYLLEIGKRLDDFDRSKKIEGVVFRDVNKNGRLENGEHGISGIQVSNGLDITITDEDGCFELDKEGIFVFLSIPNDFSMTSSWYHIISDKNMNFGMIDDEGKNSSNFTFIHYTDPHANLEKEANEIIKTAIEEMNNNEPDFVVVTGDMVFEGDKTTIKQTRKWFNRYVSLIDRLSMPVFHAMGNHDVAGIFYKEVMTNQAGYDKWLYYSYFGPSYYSFDWGNYHCIVLDPNQFDKGIQYFQLSEEQALWLKRDLSFYEKDTPLLIFFHEPFNSWADKDKIISLFGDRKVRLFSGHWHFDVLLEHHGKNIKEQVTGSLCGGWWKEDCADGRRGGYRFYQINGDVINSFYREIDQERQIEIIEPKPIDSQLNDVRALVYTENLPLISVEYQINQGKWIPLNIKEQHKWFVADNKRDFGNLIVSTELGYQKIIFRVRDKKGYFYKTIDVKISPEESVDFKELYSDFSTYQGHFVKVKGELRHLFITNQYKCDSNAREIVNGIMILKDQSGDGVILLGEYGLLQNQKLEKGQFIDAEVVPLLFTWNSISRQQKLIILLALFQLPKGLLVTEKLFKPEAVKILWLTNLQ